VEASMRLHWIAHGNPTSQWTPSRYALMAQMIGIGILPFIREVGLACSVEIDFRDVIY